MAEMNSGNKIRHRFTVTFMIETPKNGKKALNYSGG
jgi:hypothetical protein